MATRSKDIAKLLDQVRKLEGWRVEDRANGFVIFPPDGGRPMSAPHGPHNAWRRVRNLRAELRRRGADV